MTEHEEVEQKDKIKRVWHPQHEVILKQWGEMCSCYRFMHYQAHQKYRKTNMRFTLPIIIISTVTGTANFAQNTFPENLRVYIPAIIGTMNLIAAILTTLSQFLKVSELLESHRVSSIHYGKMSRTIRLELNLPISERSYDGSSMIEMMYSEFNRLIEQSPSVPSPILNQFNTLYGNQDELNKPEISTILPITPYDSNKEQFLIHDVINKFKENVFRKRSKSVDLETGSGSPKQRLESMLAVSRNLQLPQTDKNQDEQPQDDEVKSNTT